MLHAFQQGLAAHQQNQLDIAKMIYQSILDIKSNYYPALHMMGVLAAQSRDFSAAVDFISRAIKVNSSDAPAYFNLANAYMELGRIDEALIGYNNAVALNRNYAEAYANRGIALQAAGKIQEAIASFDKAIKLVPNYVDAYLNRGNALRSLELLDAAEENFRDMLQIAPNHSRALTALSKILLTKGKHEEGLRIQSAVFGRICFDANKGVLIKSKSQYAAV